MAKKVPNKDIVAQIIYATFAGNIVLISGLGMVYLAVD